MGVSQIPHSENKVDSFELIIKHGFSFRKL